MTKYITVTADESILNKIIDHYKIALKQVADNKWDRRQFSKINRKNTSIESMTSWLDSYCTTGRYFWDMLDITQGATYCSPQGDVCRGGIDNIYFECQEDAFYWDMTWLGDD